MNPRGMGNRNPPGGDPLLASYLSLVERRVLFVSPEDKSQANLSSCHSPFVPTRNFCLFHLFA